jgi:hypothetical protein
MAVSQRERERVVRKKTKKDPFRASRPLREFCNAVSKFSNCHVLLQPQAHDGPQPHGATCWGAFQSGPAGETSQSVRQ